MGLPIASGDLCGLRHGRAGLELYQQSEGFADGHGADSAGVTGAFVCAQTLPGKAGISEQGSGVRGVIGGARKVQSEGYAT